MAAMVNASLEKFPLDADWIELIREARGLGLTISEVQAYLSKMAIAEQSFAAASSDT